MSTPDTHIEGATADLASSRRHHVADEFLFALLAALRRKKVEHAKFSLLAVLLDWLQLIPYIVLPHMSWNSESMPHINIINKFHIYNIVLPYGRPTYEIAFWVCVALISFTTLLCCTTAYHAIKRSQQTFWKMRLVRRVLLLVPNALFISALEILWAPWRCAYDSELGYGNSYLRDFPDTKCWDSKNIPFAVVGAIYGFLLLGLSMLCVLMQYDPDQRTKQPQAIAAPSFPLLSCLLRALLVLCTIILPPLPFWMAVLISFLFVFWAIQLHQYMPFYSTLGNVTRVAVISALAGCSLWQLFVELFNRQDVVELPYVLLGIAPLSFLLGAVACHKELERLDGSAPHITRMNPSGSEFVVVAKFSERYHIEVSTRFLRDGRVDGDRLEQANAIWAWALNHFPDDPALLVSHANYIIAYGSDPSKANHVLERVRRLKPSFLVRYTLHLREEEGQQRRARVQGGDSAMDLATYVEFQAQFKRALQSHRKVLRQVRRFYRLVHACNLNDQMAKLVEQSDAFDLTHISAFTPTPKRDKQKGSFNKTPAAHGIDIASPRSTVRRQSHASSIQEPTGSGKWSTIASTCEEIKGNGLPGWFVKGCKNYLPRATARRVVALLAGDHHKNTSITRPAAVSNLADCCIQMERTAIEAQRSYVALLEKYPKSSKLLRAYARFHLEINQNVRDADRYFAEADAIDEGAAEEAHNGLERGGQFNASSMVDDTVDALIVINSRGIIQSVNSNCRRMFGYSESDMIGKNVSILMPPIYAMQHDAFLHNYLTSGVAKVIGSVRRLEGKHKDGHTFPIDLAVNRIETPEGINFAGVIHAIPEDETVGLVTLNEKGTILSCNKTFCRIFGWSVSEASGINIKRFMPKEYAKNHDKYLEHYRRTKRGTAVGITGRRLQGLHKNGMIFPISIEIDAVETGRKLVFNGKVTELTNAAGVVTIDEKGIVQSCNKALLSLFGFTAQNEIVGRNVNKMMPEPYASFHDQYLQRYMQSNEGRIVGGSGRYVSAKHTDGSTFPVFLKITEIKQKGKQAKRLFAAEVTLVNESTATEKQEGDELGAGAEAYEGGEDAGTAENDPLLARISINAEGKMLYTNTVLQKMFEYTSNQLKGQNVSMLMPTDIAEKHGSYLARHMETGVNRIVGTSGRHLMARHSRGYLFPIALTVEEESVGGRITYHGSIRSLLEIEGVIFADLEGKILQVNNGLCYLFGYRQAELQGKNISRLMPQPYRSEHNGYLKRWRETGKEKFINTRQIVPARHSDGGPMPVQLEATVIKHPEYGKCLAARMVAAVVTAEEAARQAEEAIKMARKTDAEISDMRNELSTELPSQKKPTLPAVSPGTPRPPSPANLKSQKTGGGKKLQFMTPDFKAEDENGPVSPRSRRPHSPRSTAEKPRHVDRPKGKRKASLFAYPKSEDLKWIFSDRSGNAVSFHRSATALAFVRDDVDEDGFVKDPEPRDAHMEGKPGGWVGFYALGTAPGLELPEKQDEPLALREFGLIPSRKVAEPPMDDITPSNSRGADSLPPGAPSVHTQDQVGSREYLLSHNEASLAASSTVGKAHNNEGSNRRDSFVSDSSIAQQLGLANAFGVAENADNTHPFAPDADQPSGHPMPVEHRFSKLIELETKQVLPPEHVEEAVSVYDELDENADILYDGLDSEKSDDDDDARSENKSAAGSMTGLSVGERRRQKHRLRQLKRIRKNQAIRQTVATMKWSTTWIAAVLVVALAINYFASRVLIVQLTSQVKVVGQSMNRAEAFQLIALAARSLELAQSLNDTDSMQVSTAVIHSAVEAAADLHTGLFLNGGNSLAVADHIQSHYETPAISTKKLLDTTNPPTYQNELVGFWDAGNAFVTAARLITAPEVAKDAYSLDGDTLESLGVERQGSIRDAFAWRYIMDNNGLVLAHAVASAEMYLDLVISNVRRIEQFQMVIFVLQLLVPIVLVLTLMRPMYNKLLAERSNMYGLFSVVPRSITLQLASLRMKVGGSGQSDSDSSDEEEVQDSDEDGAAFNLTEDSADNGEDYPVKHGSHTAKRAAGSSGHSQIGRTRCVQCAACSKCIKALAFYVTSVAYLFYVTVRGVFMMIGPLLSCRRPISMPRKVGYSLTLLMSLIMANYMISSTQLETTAGALSFLHFDERQCFLVSRVRYLSQELTYAQHIISAASSAVLRDESTATNPSITSIRNALRAAVSASQRTHNAITLGSISNLAFPGVGDGFLDLDFLKGIGKSPSIGDAESVFLSGHPQADIDLLNHQSILSSLSVDDVQARFIPNSVAGSLHATQDPLRTAQAIRRLATDPACLRRGGLFLGPTAAGMLAEAWERLPKQPGSTIAATFPQNYTIPVWLPTNPHVCLDSTDPLAPLASSGLDIVIRGVLQQGWLLANESNAELNPWNKHYQIINLFSVTDIADGCATCRQAYLAASSTALNNIHLSETLLFLAYIALVVGWYCVLLRPYISQVALETARVAALLSFLPKNVDLQKLTRAYSGKAVTSIPINKSFKVKT